VSVPAAALVPSKNGGNEENKVHPHLLVLAFPCGPLLIVLFLPALFLQLCYLLSLLTSLLHPVRGTDGLSALEHAHAPQTMGAGAPDLLES
jgi:hypothetical protein